MRTCVELKNDSGGVPPPKAKYVFGVNGPKVKAFSHKTQPRKNTTRLGKQRFQSVAKLGPETPVRNVLFHYLSEKERSKNSPSGWALDTPKRQRLVLSEKVFLWQSLKHLHLHEV